MNLRDIEYIVKIAEEGSVTKAADKLFITQSALTQQLLNLEKEIGLALFHRSRAGWTLTEAGEIYVGTAKEMLRLKKDTYNRLADLAAEKRGTLSVGVTPERGAKIFTAIYPQFHKRYPNIVVNMTEATVRRQQQLIAQGNLDVGFVTLRDGQRTGDEYLPIREEEFLLAVPSIHPVCRLAVDTGKGLYPELSLECIRHEPFALMYKESTAHDCINDIFCQAGIVPNVLFETVRAHTILNIVAARLCCSIVPGSQFLEPVEGVSFFCLPDHPSWRIMATYRKGSYLSQSTKYFISLVSQYWNEAGD
ncbi:MAG TPA: LysR family transcriptional regulator [Candidatus Ventrimonas merdavium]|nr:LysR family transcriptional regulator [Candidatus Ventrimonas merdavium]